jgi:hypothetical protein
MSAGTIEELNRRQRDAWGYRYFARCTARIQIPMLFSIILFLEKIIKTGISLTCRLFALVDAGPVPCLSTIQWVTNWPVETYYKWEKRKWAIIMFLMSYGYNPVADLPVEPLPVDNHQTVEPSGDTLPAPAYSGESLAAAMYAAQGRRRQRPAARLVKDYATTVEKRVREVNRQFVKNRLPYRLEISITGDGSVLTDLSVLDGGGNVIRTVHRNVTDDDFSRLMDDVSSGKGLLFDDIPAWTSYH